MKLIYLIAINLLVTHVFGQELISLSSANPFGFKDVITNLDNQEPQKVEAILKLPNGDGPFPLVIGVAGSLDWGSHHLEYLEMLRSIGIATLELQSFSSRGVKSTVGSQVEVTTSMMVLDAYKALDKLSTHPKINKDHIAIMGWSLGGGVALFSGWLPLVEKINPQNKFAAHLSIYPPCIAQPKNPIFSDSPMHILIGELDDWVPADACKELAQQARVAGSNIGLTVFPNSHHSFDRESPIVVKEKAYSTVDCRFQIRDDGAVLMGFLNIPMTTPLRQKIGLGICAERGPTMGGNPESRQAAFQFAQEFMSEHLFSK
jgi:dienelactone hydrolase